MAEKEVEETVEKNIPGFRKWSSPLLNEKKHGPVILRQRTVNREDQ
jgi:hypothetical protein